MTGNFWTVVMMILFPSVMSLLEVGAGFGVSHGGANLGELLHGLADLVVQQHPVGDDDGGVKDGLPALLEADELAGQPRDGVGLAAAG